MTKNTLKDIDRIDGYSYNGLNTDYRAEAVALNLMSFYEEINQLFLERLGGSKRSFHKDIESLYVELFDLGENVPTLKVHREGIYDYLPEGLFHPPTLGLFYGGVDNIVAEIRHQQIIEKDARNLFKPFEIEAFYFQLSVLMQESGYDISYNSNLLIDVLDEIFPLLDKIEKKAARIFVFLLPFFHSVRGNKKWFEKCLSAFLQIPVYVAFLPNKVEATEMDSNSLTLSNVLLGQSFVLSGSHCDGERNWGVFYGSIPYRELNLYMPDSNLRILLRVLYDFCLPVTVKVKEFFITERQNKSFTITDTDENVNRLGYSTFL